MSALEQPLQPLQPLRIAPTAEALGKRPAQAGFPRSWYLVCRSDELRRGGVVARHLLGHPLALYRGESGVAHALDAHCAHMGTHLGSGSVIGDCLRCPLHHWTFESGGQCKGARPGVGQRAWPVVERFGGVFVFHGATPLFEMAGFDGQSEADLRTRVGRNVTIECPWVGITSNAFDMRHLDVVHERALREPPTVETLDPYRLRLRYVSRVTGHGLADRTMKWLSGDHIRVCITSWGGTILTVESRVGSHTSMLLLSLMPLAQGTGKDAVCITPIFLRRHKGFAAANWVGIRMAAWLFTRFLEKDIAMMRGMRFKAPEATLPLEEPLRQFLRYVEALPKGAGGFGGEMETACGRE